jgi:pimeloyl-ACP methyl ester carboxylesterase
MTSYFFGEATSPLYGIYTPADSLTDRSEGVVLCYPLSKEYMRAHWAFRQLADLLAAKGFHVFRFDYSCTGDSAGDDADASWDRWVADIGAAMGELRDASGARKISLVGLRAGACLALEAAPRFKADRLVLWDPLVDGPTYFGELESARGIVSFRYPKVIDRLRSYRTSSAVILPKTLPTSLVHGFDSTGFSEIAAGLSAAGPKVRRVFCADAGGWGDPASWEARLLAGPALKAIADELQGGTR